MIDKEHIERQIESLRRRIVDMDGAIDEHKRRIRLFRQHKKKLKKELLENQQFLWRIGGKE